MGRPRRRVFVICPTWKNSPIIHYATIILYFLPYALPFLLHPSFLQLLLVSHFRLAFSSFFRGPKDSLISILACFGAATGEDCAEVQLAIACTPRHILPRPESRPLSILTKNSSVKKKKKLSKHDYRMADTGSKTQHKQLHRVVDITISSSPLLTCETKHCGRMIIICPALPATKTCSLLGINCVPTPVHPQRIQ